MVFIILGFFNNILLIKRNRSSIKKKRKRMYWKWIAGANRSHPTELVFPVHGIFASPPPPNEKLGVWRATLGVSCSAFSWSTMGQVCLTCCPSLHIPVPSSVTTYIVASCGPRATESLWGLQSFINQLLICQSSLQIRGRWDGRISAHRILRSFPHLIRQHGPMWTCTSDIAGIHLSWPIAAAGA